MTRRTVQNALTNPTNAHYWPRSYYPGTAVSGWTPIRSTAQDSVALQLRSLFTMGTAETNEAGAAAQGLGANPDIAKLTKSCGTAAPGILFS